MRNLTFICDGCGRVYEYKDMRIPQPGRRVTHRSLDSISMLVPFNGKELCRKCLKDAGFFSGEKAV